MALTATRTTAVRILKRLVVVDLVPLDSSVSVNFAASSPMMMLQPMRMTSAAPMTIPINLSSEN